MYPAVSWGRKRLHWSGIDIGPKDLVEISRGAATVRALLYLANEISQATRNKTVKILKNLGNLF